MDIIAYMANILVADRFYDQWVGYCQEVIILRDKSGCVYETVKLSCN
jgi:hypothetical protein